MKSHYIVIFLLIQFFAGLNFVSSQMVKFPIVTSDGVYTDTLFFGVDSLATDGVDTALGEQELPPPPPPPSFDVRFTPNTNPPLQVSWQGLKKDFRFGRLYTDDTIKHNLEFKTTTNNFKICWNGIPSNIKIRIQDHVTGTLIDTTFTGTGCYVFSFAVLGQVYFTVYYDPIVYPVELLSFTSSIINTSVLLNWTAANEINNYGFEVQRRGINSSEWKRLGFVNAASNGSNQHEYSFADNNVPAGKYYYRLKQIDLNGNFEYFSLNNLVEISSPSEFYLSQNYPNPFNPETTIQYKIPEDGPVNIVIYDMLGRNVMTLVDEFKVAGLYEIQLNSIKLTSGNYYYVLNAGGKILTKNFIVVK